MSSIQQLKSRLGSINNTRQITKAMGSVATSKMRRAANRSRSTHPYHKYISDLLASLAGQGLAERHPLFAHRDVKARLLIVIASDTGLAGAYNSNVFKRYLAEVERDKKRNVKTLTISVGKKATLFASRLGGELIGAYENIGSDAAAARGAIIDTVLTKFRSEEVDAVDVIYTDFTSSTKQSVRTWNFLPAGHIEGDENPEREVAPIDFYTFEPNKEKVFGALVKRSLEAQLAQALFDSAASEHSMRMLAMKNATDNADELSEDLTIVINKERQAIITNELSDISNGVNAVS